MEIGFTGSKKEPNVKQSNQLLNVLIGLKNNKGALWMNNGDCVGSDKLAYDHFKSIGGLVRGHIPIRDRYRAFCDFDEELRPAGYLERNKTIVDYSDIIVAVSDSMLEKPRGGTWHTIRYARKCKKPIIIILPNGAIQYEPNRD